MWYVQSKSKRRDTHKQRERQTDRESTQATAAPAVNRCVFSGAKGHVSGTVNLRGQFFRKAAIYLTAYRSSRVRSPTKKIPPAPCRPPEAVNLGAMKIFRCLAAALTLGGAQALISPSLSAGFQKRTLAVRAPIPIDQLREALITSKAFTDLVERLEKKTHLDADVVDAAQGAAAVRGAQANFGLDNPSNAGAAATAGGADRIAPATSPATTEAATTASTSAASEPAAKFSSQQQKRAATAAPGSSAATTSAAAASSESESGSAPAQAAPKLPALNLFGIGREKSPPPKQKSGIKNGTPEKGVADAQVAAAKVEQEELQVCV